MQDFLPDELAETPTVEVRVYHDGELIARELCEDSEQVADVLGAWAEVDGVECEVDDLAVHHRPGDILEPEPDELDVEAGYPHGAPGPGAER